MDEKSLFSTLTPEQLAALLQGSTLQDKGSLLAEELQQLLASPTQHVEHSTPLGAGIGGLAEALDSGLNAYHVAALRGDQRRNLDQQSKLMSDFGALLRQPATTAAAAPATPVPTSAQPPAELPQLPQVELPKLPADLGEQGLAIDPMLDLTRLPPRKPGRGISPFSY